MNYEGDGIPTLADNLCFPTWEEAGLTDETSGHLAAGSPAIGAGTAGNGLSDDYYGTARTSHPDIGAVQH